VSRTNLEIVEQAILAVNARDATAYGNLCHRDWELVTPLAPLEGPLRGEAGVREFSRNSIRQLTRFVSTSMSCEWSGEIVSLRSCG
jgi:hypothetical protein